MLENNVAVNRLPLRWPGLRVTVQDFTSPMLAQIPPVLLAANVGTILELKPMRCSFIPTPRQRRKKFIRECIGGATGELICPPFAGAALAIG